MPTFNYARAAAAIADTVLMGDEEAAKKHGVSTRSIWRWRDRMKSDPRLAAFVNDKLKIKEKDWIEDLPVAIASGIGFLKRAADEANHRDPLVIAAVCEGLRTLTSIETTRKIVDAQLKSLGHLPESAAAETDEGFEGDYIDTAAEEVD